MAGATWGSGSGEEEEEEDGPAVLVEQQTDSAMEPTGPTRERYKDGVVTIGCVGKDTGWGEDTGLGGVWALFHVRGLEHTLAAEP